MNSFFSGWENAFAQKVSKSDEMKNVLIAAPIDYLHVNDNWDEVVLIDPDDTASVSLWNIFMNGELISTIDGDDKPTFDELVRLFLTYLNN